MKKIVAIALAAVGLTACGGGGDDAAPAPAPAVFSVSYSVTGLGPFDVTYATAAGGTAQESGVTSFSKSFTASSGASLYLSAQTRSSSAVANVTSTITVNGTTFKKTTSSGPFVIATSSAACC